MANRRVNPNLVKLHRTYDVSELARRCGVHKNTVLNWRAQGLTPIDGSKPVLFHGAAVREFLKKRNNNRKQPCGPGKLFCFRCKQPRAPAFGLADYASVTAKAPKSLLTERQRTPSSRSFPGQTPQLPEAYSLYLV